MLTNNITQGQYDFQAEPKVMKPRTKYREAPVIEEELTASNANIMFDKRVVRGNTYAIVGTTSREAVQPLKNTTNRPRPKHLSPKHLEASQMEAIHADVSTPRPVEGRKHTEVQTDENIEYLTDRPPEFEKDAQTDFYIDRPVNRLFVPQKIGEDKETQIWEGELFDFDYEVEPILQTLIGKTIEQGRMEVLEEEEHNILKEEQKRYDELRYAELTEAQKMEAEERRKLDESERRRKQHRLKNEQATTSHKKYISRLMAKTCLENVNRNTFNILREQGSFQNAFEFELHRGFLSWVYEDIVGLQNHGFTIDDTINALNAIISQNVAKANEEAIQKEIHRKQKVVEDQKKQEEEKVERRRERAEARAKRTEEERLSKLKEKILVTLIAKGEQKAGVLSQVFSDIDALGRTGNIVGLLGGLVGELLIVLSTLEDFKQVEDEADPLFALQSITITQESIQKLVKHVVEDLIKEGGRIEVGVNGELEAQLAAIDAELNLENLHTKMTLAAEIKAALVSSLSSAGLDIILKNANNLKLQEGHVELIANAIADIVLSPDESARKLKLVRPQMEYLQENRLEAYAQFMPPIEGLPMFNLAEAKGVRTKKAKKDKEVAEQTGTIEGQVPEEYVEPVITPAEVEFEDLVSIFPMESPEDRVLVHQKPAAIVLRRLMLIYLSTLFKEMDMKEIEVLKKVNNKADEVEKALIGQFPVKINLFVFDRS